MSDRRTIQFPSGGGIALLDLSPFSNPAVRVDPRSLPDLPAGISIGDLTATLPALSPEDAKALQDEIEVRRWGYLPCRDGSGFDQYGYDRDGFDSEGLDHNGFRRDEADLDPLLAPSPPRPPMALRTGEVDKRIENAGKIQNRGGKGQVVYASDGRTLSQCWFDVFVHNESCPVHKRLTNEEIALRICDLFPNRAPKYISVNLMRWRYNHGKLALQKQKPIVQSFRYVRSEDIVARVTTRGRILEQWNVADALSGERMKAEAQPETRADIDADSNNQTRQDP